MARATPLKLLKTGRRTLALRRSRVRGARVRLTRGTYRVRVTARTTTTPARSYVVAKRYRLRR